MSGGLSLSLQRSTDTRFGIVLQFPNKGASSDQQPEFGEPRQPAYIAQESQRSLMQLPDTPHAERYREFNEQLDALSKDDAQLLFGKEKGTGLTEQNVAVLDLLARYRTGPEIQEILDISESRVSQHKRAARERISSVTGLKIKRQAELIDAYVVLRHRLQKPVYLDRKLTPLNKLLEQVEPDQSAQDILDIFTSEEFKVLLPELEAGGLRALRARLGRWYPAIWMTAVTLAIGVIGIFVTLFAVGLDVILR